MRKSASWMVLCAAALWPSLAAAGNDPNLDPAQEPARARQEFPKTSALPPLDTAEAWGTLRGAKWIAASQFTVTLSNGPTLDYAGNHFYHSPGSASPTRYYAQLDVDPGSLVDAVTCVYSDPSAVNDVSFSLQKYTTNISTGASDGATLATFTTTGSAGVGFDFLFPDSPETITTLDGEVTLFNYYIAADVADDTRIAGCWVFHKRQVAPGPATATFADVPTTSPYFRFVEALADSGVTGGCGGGNYCPDAPITRGQMAVFLAVALGMGYRY